MGGGSSAPIRSLRAPAAGDGAIPPLAGLLAGLRLALGAGNMAADRDALSGVADWPALARLAAYHRVSGLFLRGVENGGVQLSDRGVADALARMRRRDVRRGMRQLDVMRRVTAGLDTAGIPSLVLKGLPLGQRAYGDPFAKASIDVDLLVPADAFAAAADMLRKRGWRCVTPGFRETPARRRWYESVQKEDVFTGGGAVIELHRRFFGNRFLFNPPFDRIHAAGEIVVIGTGRFRTLGDADQLLYLACHGANHFWYRLKWLCDFAALIGVMDRELLGRAFARARQKKLGTVLASALRLCQCDLQVALPEVAASWLPDGPRIRFAVRLSRRAWTPRRGTPSLAWWVTMRLGRVVLGDRSRYRLHEARALAIRYLDFCELDLPDRIFWLYALARPVLWARRQLRRALARRGAEKTRDTTPSQRQRDRCGPRCPAGGGRGSGQVSLRECWPSPRSNDGARPGRCHRERHTTPRAGSERRRIREPGAGRIREEDAR